MAAKELPRFAVIDGVWRWADARSEDGIPT
jgi:hypothetical protein